jgi:hypothetical protein
MVMRLVFAALLFCVACHDHEHEGFDTFQACFDDHAVEESLPFQEAVVVCCLDHPIDGVSEACGATAADCVTYLGANLTSTATQADVQAACTEYIAQKGM